VPRLTREPDDLRRPAIPGVQRVERQLEVGQLPAVQLLGQNRELGRAVPEMTAQNGRDPRGIVV
jgi:hypothetical protein